MQERHEQTTPGAAGTGRRTACPDGCAAMPRAGSRAGRARGPDRPSRPIAPGVLCISLVAAALAAASAPAVGQHVDERAAGAAMDADAAAGDTATLRVMVLGTYHFANPGQDVINTEADDVLAPDRQAQIRAVVDSLVRFRPTKVAVEWPYENAARFDSIYRAYRDGRHALTRNERQQLGMRLAGRMDHEHIYAIDSDGEFPFREVMAYAEAHQPGFVEYFERLRDRLETRSDSMQANATVGEILRARNTPSDVAFTYEPYMRMTEVGGDSVYVGVRPVAAYYERNLKIFANLLRIAEPGDRIIVIFGSGHSPFLRQFVDGHPRMELIEPLDFL